MFTGPNSRKYHLPPSLSETAEQGPRELRHSSQNASRFVITTNAHDINKDGSLQTALLLSLTETVKTLSDKVNSIQTLQAPATNWCGRPDRRGYDEDFSKGAEYTLASSMSTSTNPASPSTSNLNQASHTTDCGSQQTQCQAPVAGSQLQIAPPNSSQTYGFAADSLPFVETVSPAIRRQVIEGKDVNLAVLLIPYYTGPMSNDERIDTYFCSNRKPDPRLNKCLNI